MQSPGQTARNAERLETAVADGAVPVPHLLAQLPREEGSVSILRFAGGWYPTSLPVGPEVVPAALRGAALGGQAVRQRIGVDGGTRPAVGVPIEGGAGA